jgi:hypothetical protein
MMKPRRIALHAIALALLTAHACAAGGRPVSAQTGPHPGATDPLGKPSRYHLFPSHDLWAPGVVAGNGFPLADDTYFHDPNLQLFNQAPVTHAGDMADPNAMPAIFAAAGRVTRPDYDQVVYARRNGSDVRVMIVAHDQGQAPAVSYDLPNLASRIVNSPTYGFTTDLISIAVADQDKVQDQAGHNHDEVVVAYASPAGNNQLAVNVAVLDYTASTADATKQPVAVITATASNLIDADINAGLSQVLLTDNLLSVAIGDFDGNGLNEIVVVYVQNNTTAIIAAFRYTRTGQNRALQQVTALSEAVSSYGPTNAYVGSISAAAGDFNGDDIDELVVAYGDWFVTGPAGFAVPYFRTYQSDKNLNLTREDETPNPLLFNFQLGNVEAYPRVGVLAGLFQFNPTAGFDIGRRQIALGVNGADGSLNVQTYSISTDLQTATGLITTTTQIAGGGARWSLAAGKFRGNADPEEVIWDLAYMAVTSGQVTVGTLDGQTGAAGPSTTAPFILPSGAGLSTLRMPLAAYDYSGQSFYLGASVHFQVESAVRTDYVLQEPPKHSYYDGVPNAANNNNPTYQIVTVSRYDDFNINLTDSEGTTFASQSTDKADWTIGGSESVAASATFGEDSSLDLVGVSDETTVAVSETASYDYNDHKESYDAQYGSRTITFQGKTDHDDYLGGRLQMIDVWRYRMYGLAATDQNGNPTNGFYDIVLPGPTQSFAGGGTSFADWYQPTYENGNILSYPAVLGSNPNDPFLPDDLGGYTVTNGVTTMLVTQPLIAASLQAFGGTSGSFALAFADTTGSGNSRSYSNSLGVNADVDVSNKVSADFLGDEGGASIDVSVAFNTAMSWGSVTTSDQTTNTSTGITLNKRAGSAAQGYVFYPVFYITEDGTLKAAHAVNVLGDSIGQSFWAGVYGAKSDPAVNLPVRFVPVYGGSNNNLIGWQPNQLSSRKQIRGFFLTNTTPNTVTNQYDPLAYAPIAGDLVRVDARVYNYSTGQPFTNLSVQFQAIPYDATSDTETSFDSCPGGLTLTNQGRCIVGQTTIPSLQPLQMTNAVVTWNTTGFGPSPQLPSQMYRIYVVLDPNDTIDEIYESEDPHQSYQWVDVNGQSHDLQGIDPGQNNEGYGYATVAVAPSRAAGFTASQPRSALASPGAGANAYLTSDSLAIRDIRNGELRSDAAQVRLFQSARLRLTLRSDKNHREFNHVLVYDGNPSQGGVLIADKIVHSGNPNGAHVWVDWIPLRPGRHELFAKVVKDHDDPVTDNGADTLLVTVVSQRLYFPFMPFTLWRR